MSWKNRQKAIVKIYQGYAEIADTEYRAMLHQYTGAMSSTHRALTQWAFDTFMPVLELRAHEHFLATGNPPPRQIQDWWYWRNRNPMDGTMNTRHKHKIWALWGHLQPMIVAGDGEPVHDPVAYMRDMAQQAVGHEIPNFWEMRTADAMLLIEALKSRLAQELRRAA